MTKPIILCATDLSPDSRTAVELSAVAARALAGEVVLVHATDALVDDEPSPPSVAPALDAFRKRIAERRADAVAKLEEERTRIASSSVAVTSVLVDGPAATAILREASDRGATLVVLGRQHRDETLMGKTIDAVIRHVECPVLVAPPSSDRAPTLDGRWLVGYDGSELGRLAVRAAHALVSRVGGSIAIVQVVPPVDGEDEPYEARPPSEILRSESIKQLLRELTDFSHDAAEDAPCELVKTLERPSDELLRIGEERDVAGIVIGTHGRAGIWRFLLGSTALRLLRHADRPIPIVRRTGANASGWFDEALDTVGPLATCATHMVVGIDFSDSSRRALVFASDLAKKLGSRITAVHAYDPPSDVRRGIAGRLPPSDASKPTPPHPLRARLAAVVAEALGPDAPRVGIEVVGGRPVEALLGVAARVGADLVVAGTAGRTGMARALLGSVAEALVRQSPIPVLTTH